jgi:hypothetical protein
MSASLSDVITWDFVVSGHLKANRYGHAGNVFYKQYLPNGNVYPEINPPRVIDKRQYDMAAHADKVDGLVKTITTGQ